MQEPQAPSQNPYVPPQAQLEVAAPTSVADELASRWSRLGGALLDGVFRGIVSAPMWIARTAVSRYNFLGGPFQHWHLSDTRGLLGGALMLGLLIVQWYLVATRGQTLGKMLVGTRIVRMDGRPVGFKNGVVLRAWVTIVAGWIPVLGGLFSLADALSIFGGQKRCLHDLIADTKVVRVDPRPPG